MKKELIKNFIRIGIIILFACIATYMIYNKFHTERSVDYSSKSLDIIFHETTGDKITLDKITPLTDNLGLSSTPYDFTITNNLTEDVDLKIKLVEDKDQVKEDNCEEKQIPKKYIKVAIKENGKNKILTLDELEDNVLLDTKINALEKNTYTVRIWTSQDIESTELDLHYHGKIQIVENETIIARR